MDWLVQVGSEFGHISVKGFWSLNSWSSNMSKSPSHPGMPHIYVYMYFFFPRKLIQLPSLESFLSYTRDNGDRLVLCEHRQHLEHCIVYSAWGQDNTAWVVIWGYSEVLSLHFIDELDEKQSRGSQVTMPNSCTKPLKWASDPNVIVHLIAHIPRVKSSDFTTESSVLLKYEVNTAGLAALHCVHHRYCHACHSRYNIYSTFI